MTENIPIVTLDLMRPSDKNNKCNNWIDGVLRFLTCQKGDYYASAWIPISTSWDEIFDKRGGKTGKHIRSEYRRVQEKGYYCAQFLPQDHIQDIYEINHSKAVRQLNAMRLWYVYTPEELMHNFARTTTWNSDCPLHWESWYGVFTKDKKLVGFIHLMRAGQYLGYSSILGHAGYWKDEIMLFLHFYLHKLIRESNDEHYKGVSGMAYYLWVSGTANLMFWKEKAGFKKYHLAWIDTQSPIQVVEQPVKESHQGPHP